MSTLVRTNQPRRDASGTKVLLVRRPVKSVDNDDQQRTTLQMTIGVVATLGTLVAIWLIGHIGYSLGFAASMRVPGLSIAPDAAFSSGVLVLLKAPRMIFELGLANPMWLMLAFVLIAIPAAGIAAANPPKRGGARPSQFAVFMSYSAAILGLINAAALVGWTISPARGLMIGEIPLNPEVAALWLLNLRSAAGLDALAVICAGIWVVLIFRLTVPIWMKAIASSVTIFTLALLLVNFAISNGAASQLDAPRADCVLNQNPSQRMLLIGQSSRQTVVLLIRDDRLLVELHGEPLSYISLGRLSISQFLRQPPGAVEESSAGESNAAGIDSDAVS